jgi:hypothetical protein
MHATAYIGNNYAWSQWKTVPWDAPGSATGPIYLLQAFSIVIITFEKMKKDVCCRPYQPNTVSAKCK